MDRQVWEVIHPELEPQVGPSMQRSELRLDRHDRIFRRIVPHAIRYSIASLHKKIALISRETTENPRNPARFGNPSRRQCACRNGYIFPRRSRNGTRDLGGMLAAGISRNLGDACADAELCNWRAMDRDAGTTCLRLNGSDRFSLER